VRKSAAGRVRLVQASGLVVSVCALTSACSSPTEPSPSLGFAEERVFATYTAVNVAYSSAGTMLAGTLYLPPGSGTHPALVTHFGSDRWTRASSTWAEPWLERGIAVLSYDKRGVGQSGGTCCPLDFDLLASDVLAGVAAARSHPRVDPERVGLWGFSQGGWVVPHAAVRDPSIAFVILGSGPTVSVGEEILYSVLTGEAECEATGRSPEEIDAELDRAGPSLFDPRTDLEALAAPGLWVYCAGDLSVPVERSVAILEELVDQGQDFSVVVFTSCNHVWVQDGGICQFSGATVDWEPAVFGWLLPRLGLTSGGKNLPL